MKNLYSKSVLLLCFSLFSVAIFSRILGVMPGFSLQSPPIPAKQVGSAVAQLLENPPVLIDCGENYYDPGGPTGDYQNNQVTQTTICPTTPGEFVEVTFTSFDTEFNYDILYAYNGNNTFQSIVGLSGDALPPIVASNHSSGCLTFYFNPYNTEVGAGWEATVACTTCPRVNNMRVEQIKPTSVRATFYHDGQFSPNFYEYEVGLPGFVPGNGEYVATGTSNTYEVNVSGLTPDTEYEVYMRMQCVGGEYGAFNLPVAFRTAPTCGDYFYDSGGENGGISNVFEPTVTICPDQPGYFVTVDFEEFNMLGNYMYVYSGMTGSNDYLGNFADTILPPKLTSFDNSGCLTFIPQYAGVFNNGNNWKAAVGCVSCPSPYQFSYQNLTGTSVTLNWSTFTAATLYQWEIGPVGFEPGTGAESAAGNSTSQYGDATGLESGTEHDAYVRAMCQNGQFGEWKKLSFTTYPTCGDSFYDEGGANNNFGPNLNYVTVICPDVPGSYASVDFTSFNIGTSSLTVYDGNNTGGSYLGSYSNTNSPGIITATNNTGCISFFFYSYAGTAPGWEATTTCVTCPNPYGLFASSATLSSVSLNWQPLNNVQNYFYEIVPFGEAPGTGAAVVSGSVAANSIFVAGLESGTIYQAYVKAICGAGDESEFSNPVVFSTLPTCGDSFYDIGGPSGSPTYNQGQGSLTVICPDVPGTYVQVDFSEFGLMNCCNYLTVYDGDNTNTGSFLQLTGTNLPSPISSHAPNGCLTFYYNSNTTDTLPGWAAEVSCVPCPNPRGAYVSALTSSTVQMNWSSNPTPATYNWEIGLVGFEPGTGTEAASGTTAQLSAIAIGLESGTQYEFYLRANCSPTEASSFSGPYRVSTYPTCGDIFTDNGGPNGNIILGDPYTTVICPDQPGYYIELDFTQFEMGDCCASLTIMDGSNGGQMIGQYANNNSPGTVTSNNNTGCLVVSTYQGGLSAPGWLANVNCVTCPTPNSLRAHQVGGGNGTFYWNFVAAASEYQWELGLPGFVPGSGTSLQSGSVSTNSVDILGLDGATDYELYVWSICNANAASNYGQPLRFTTTPSCGDLFTDRGGATGNYGQNENYSTRICAQVPGEYVALDFTEFSVTTNFAYLYVSDGFLTHYYNNDKVPGKIYSYNNNGCFDITFQNNSNETSAGWVAEVSCISCPPPANFYPIGTLTHSSFSVQWFGPGNANTYDWEVGLEGFTPGTGQALQTGNTSQTNTMVTGLSGQTTYDFYVKTNCGTTDASPFSNRYRITTGPSCGDMFYDPSGPDSSYVSGSLYSTTTICPDVPGTVVEVTFEYLDIHPWEDNVYVYDGDNSSAPLIQYFNGMAMPLPGPFVATNPTGCLTFYLAANASGTWNGWEASVNCVTCPSVGGLMVSASNNIQINWNTNPTATSYYWEIGELGFVPGTGTAIDSSTTNGTSVEVVGLPTGKQLEVYVRANCASGETSSFGNGARFSTPATCGDDFYDTGGQVGTYNANESYATTICPQGDNQHVTVTFNGFQMDGCCDYLNVYNGPSQNHPIMAQLGGFPSLPLAYTSTDVSGCLTFYFYSDGSNQGAGWSADVSCDGCVLPLDLEANNVNSNGANISWQGNNDVDSYNYEIGLKGFVPGIGTAVVVNNTTSTSINISTLAAGVEYDAYVRSVCDGGTEVGDFAGPLTFETPVSCGSTSYDSGGPDNDYGPNEDYYTLICPEVSGTKVWLDFTMFETQQCCDKLEILDGNTESAPVIGSFAGNTLPGAVAATNATGCVMLHFTSDATVHRSGWAADVYCTESSTEPDKLRSGSLLISPNPAKDVLYVTLPNEAGGDLQVVDVAGRVKWTGKAAAGKRQVTIPLEGLNSGIYLVRWQSAVSRFVVAP